MQPRTLAHVGFGTACVGLAIASLLVLPVFQKQPFPLPLFIGTVFYFIGAPMVFIASKKLNDPKMLQYMRFVRWGFFAVCAMIAYRMTR